MVGTVISVTAAHSSSATPATVAKGNNYDETEFLLIYDNNAAMIYQTYHQLLGI